MRGVLHPTEGQSEDDYAKALEDMLRDDPNNTFVVQAWDGDSLVALLVAFAGSGQSHVFIYDAWADPQIEDNSLTHKMFVRLLLWAESIGRTQVRCETSRPIEAITKRWGFTEHAKILKYEIEEAFEETLIDKLTEGNGNGQQQRPDSNKRPERSPEGRGGRDKEGDSAGVGVHPEAGREGGQGQHPFTVERGGTDRKGAG